jgi:chorismate synthase
MSSNTGVLFRVTTWGESHGGALGAVIDGCPPGIELDIPAIQEDLNRRRPGQSDITTPRKEADKIEILSGLFEGKTLGSCLSLVIYNKDANPDSYRPFKDLYRPSHADFTTEAKYGIRNWQGGGRASARETAARVAAGAVAKQVLRELAGVEIVGWVDQVGEIAARVDSNTVTRADVEANNVRCPDPVSAKSMRAIIKEVQGDGDTIGGVVRCVARGVPAGLGEPVFDKLEADIAKAMLSLPAAKGFESGLGYGSVGLRGSEHNDLFRQDATDTIRTNTNNSGGIQGGISNGMPITISVVFKPVATIFHPQETVNTNGETATITAKGRHDPCVLPRAVPMVEAGVALVLVDHLLRQRGIVGNL